MSRVRFAIIVLIGLLIAQCACVALPHGGDDGPPEESQRRADSKSIARPIAPVVTAADSRGAALSKEARMLVERAAGGRIATRIYLSQPAVDPSGTFTFDESAVRSHIARRAPSRDEGCIFIVDLEHEYYKALRSGNKAEIAKTVELFERAVQTAKEARPGEPVMVYGIPNRNWSRFDLSLFEPVFSKVDYINLSAYAGKDRTYERYCARIDANMAISQPIADRYKLELVAHVNPRFEDQSRIPLDEFIDMMRYVKSKGVNHVVYWQPPWTSVKDLEADGKPAVLSDRAWQAAVEECYLCALLKVFDPENPESKACRTTLPAEADDRPRPSTGDGHSGETWTSKPSGSSK